MSLCYDTQNTQFCEVRTSQTHRPHSSVRYVPMTHTPHSSVRYVPTAVCLCRILSRFWRRNRKGTKLTRTVLLFILRPTASFAVPPSYTLVCALVTVSVCPPLGVCCGLVYPHIAGFCCSIRLIAGFYTPYCVFLYPLLWVSIRSIVGFYTLCFGFLYPLVWVSMRSIVGFYTL